MKTARIQQRFHSSRRDLVLIVDEDETRRQELANVLAENEIPSLQVSDGLTALTLAHEPAICLLIVNLLLPGVSGLEVLRVFRRCRGSDIRILMTSSIHAEAVERLALAEGADLFMKYELDSIVEQVLDPSSGLADMASLVANP